MNDPFQKLNSEVGQFFDVYKVLDSEGRAQFEAQMGPILKSADAKTVIFYKTVLDAAKRGLSADEATDLVKKSLIQEGQSNQAGQDQGNP